MNAIYINWLNSKRNDDGRKCSIEVIRQGHFLVSRYSTYGQLTVRLIRYNNKILRTSA